MKKWLAGLLVLVLTGCAGTEGKQEPVRQLRQQAASSEAAFSVRITADYIDSVETFSMDCRWSPSGTVAFTVTQPGEISGIRGTVSGEKGTLEFEDTILALPLMAQDRLSPLCGPWLFMQALAAGQLTAVTAAQEEAELTLRSSFRDDAPEVEVRLEQGLPRAAEISWRGRRNLVLEIESFAFAEKAQMPASQKSEAAAYSSSVDVGQ